jgi:hypothetical protein
MNELVANQILTGERNYEAALNLVIKSAERELLIFDQDLSKGDYTSLARLVLLRDFLTKNRLNKLVIVLNDTGYFINHCPRLCELLQTHSHAMTVYATNEEAKVAKEMFLIADQTNYLRRFHTDQARFKYAFDDLETVNMLNKRFDELLQATTHTVSITTLGL